MPSEKAFAKFTPEERVANGRKGGLTKGENYRRRKLMRETLDVLLDMPVNKGRATDVEKIQAFANLKGKNITVDQAMMVKLVQKALTGDLNAIAMIRDTVGEKPSDKIEVKDVTPVIISGEDDLIE